MSKLYDRVFLSYATYAYAAYAALAGLSLATACGDQGDQAMNMDASDSATAASTAPAQPAQAASQAAPSVPGSTRGTSSAGGAAGANATQAGQPATAGSPANAAAGSGPAGTDTSPAHTAGGPSGSAPHAAAGDAAAMPAAGQAGSAAMSGRGAESGGAQNAAGDAADPGVTSSADCAGSLCEGFEDMQGETLGDGWEVATSNCMGTGTVSVDSAQAHSGTRSIRVNGAGGYCNHVFFRPTSAPWNSDAPRYARFYVRLDKALTQSHVTFVALHDEQEMKDLRMGGQSEILMWNRESDDATLPELSPTGIAASVKPQTGQWLCVEFLIDGAAGQLQTWLDGEPVMGLTVEGDPTPDVDAQWQRKPDWHPKLSDVRFGWESYGGDENTLWFDDLVLGTSRVGCDGS